MIIKKNNLEFFDVHAHLDLIPNIKEVIKKTKKKNIKKIISCSTSFESNKKNLELSQKFFEIECALGLYPLNLIELNEKELKTAFSFFKKNIKKSIAIGEIGLDYKYSLKKEEQEKQIKYFEEFIKLGKKEKKPLIIHSRYAQKKVLEILEENNAQKVLLHSFIESKKLMKRAFENNYFISVGPILLKDELVQERITEAPLKKIFFETDSPIKFDQKTIYPEQVILLSKKTALLKKINLKKIILQQKQNYKNLFIKKN